MFFRFSSSNLGIPYLEDGKICQEMEEMVEEMEYDQKIQCRVMMKEECADDADDADNEIVEHEACHMMYKKQCDISYRPKMTKVKVISDDNEAH